MTIAGETRHKGNLLFDLHIEDDKVIFKPKKGIKTTIEFICSAKQKEELLKVQEQCLRKEFSVAISFSDEFISFCYDEEKLNKEQFFFKDLKCNRVIGID